MNFTVDHIISKIDKPFLYVDYNEIMTEINVFMLSQHDVKNNYFGHPVQLYDGLKIIGYEEDEDIEGNRDDLIMEGICILNKTGVSNHVKWLIKGNEKGIRYAREIIENGW
ncbi:MAG: hypothetical protein ACRCWR_01675 [Saezia sp.]